MAVGIRDQLQGAEGGPTEFFNPRHVRELTIGQMLAKGPQETADTTERVAAILAPLHQGGVGCMHLGTTLG